MLNYSIELKAREIKHPRTKEYFQEVFGSYTQGYYRSAIVMLWSVVVTDLLLKLEDLINSEDGANYQSIKTEIDDIRKENRKSSEWELKLVNLLNTRSELLDNADVSNLEALQQLRHLSAHPVITNDEVLYMPNQDLVRGHILIALDSVFTKPSLMGRKVLFNFLQAIANFESNASPEAEDLKKFILVRYINKMGDNAICKMFPELWKFVFEKIDENSSENRALNARALTIIYREKKALLDQYFNTHSETKFSVGMFENQDRMVPLCGVFMRTPELYERIDADSKAIFTSTAKSSKRFAIISPFLCSSSVEYFESVENAEGDYSETLYSYLSKFHTSYFEDEDALISFGIKHFSESTSFDNAFNRWKQLLSPLIDHATDQHIYQFCESVMKGRARFGGIVQCLGCSSAINKICEIIIDRKIKPQNLCERFYEQYKSKLTEEVEIEAEEN